MIFDEAEYEDCLQTNQVITPIQPQRDSNKRTYNTAAIPDDFYFTNELVLLSQITKGIREFPNYMSVVFLHAGYNKQC